MTLPIEIIHYDPVTRQIVKPQPYKEYEPTPFVDISTVAVPADMRHYVDAGYCFVDSNMSETNKGILTRYGKKLLEEGAKYYSSAHEVQPTSHTAFGSSASGQSMS